MKVKSCVDLPAGRRMRPGDWAMLLALAFPQVAAGQIAERVGGLGDGTVRFSYDVRDDVEICEQGIHIGERRVSWRSRGWDDDPSNCRSGFAEVELRVRGGLVRDVEVIRSLGDRSEGASEVGRVSAEEASRYLFSLARKGATERGAKEAIFPAMLADVEEVWRDLMDIATARDLDGDVRKNALFWLGQEAADAATQGLAEVASSEDEDQEIRNAAIFALSQRPTEEGLPVLMELARTGAQAETRRTAMFWLAQSGDDSVIVLFEEILLGRVRD